MRTIAILTATALLAFTSCRQNRAVENADATDPQEWPQLDEFHFVMAESFHPYADSGNLEPARKYAAELTRALLNELSRETAAFREMASTASDDSLGASLTSIHDLFHKIQDSWYSSAHVDPEH